MTLWHMALFTSMLTRVTMIHDHCTGIAWFRLGLKLNGVVNIAAG